MISSATVSPTIATAMIKNGLGWRDFYFTLIGGAVVELASGAPLFWRENAEQFRLNNPKTTGGAEKSRFAEAVSNRVTITVAAFLFVYTGVEGEQTPNISF